MTQFDNNVMERLSHFPSLKSVQWDRITDAVRERIERRLGEAPQQEEYLKSAGERPDIDNYVTGSVWRNILKISDPTDSMLIPILIVLLLISFAHMLTFSGDIAQASYHQRGEDFQGIWLDLRAWMLTHQIGFFALSELGVLFFYSHFSMNRKRRVMRGVHINYWAKDARMPFKFLFDHFSLILAFSFAIITIYANVNSLTSGYETSVPFITIAIAVFIGFLVPVTTMYLGERISELILEAIAEREKGMVTYQGDVVLYDNRVEEALNRYNRDIDKYYAVLDDPEQFNEGKTHNYRMYLASAIIDYYKRYIKIGEKGSKELYEDWDRDLEMALAGRELASLKQAQNLERYVDFFTTSDSGSDELTTSSQNSQPESVRPYRVSQ
jgi:hypothetical protein